MVKCPKGTASQINANVIKLKKLNELSSETDFVVYDEEKEETPEFSEDLELDSNKADKRETKTSRDDLVNFFVGYMLDTLLESWCGRPCYRPKLTEPVPSTPSLSEFYGEDDLSPCESNIFETTENINDLYKKRSSTLERSFENQKKKSFSDSNETSEFGQNAEEEFGRLEAVNSWKTEPDEEVHLVFLNGAWYKGRVSRKLMDGEGTYFWEDGTLYSGEFIGGCATGKGRIEFPSQSVYEGGVYKGFRHGEGMHCLYESPVMYTGQWWLGKKHGEGLIVYNEPLQGHNYYRGHWQDGVREGFGYRQYPSGAKYIGYWSNGKRHGNGVMLWRNNDIYRGQWKEGLMHGYGEYTWNGFINKTLSYPATNTYRGSWKDGKRSGRGIFETINEGVIDTMWEDNLKNGPGLVICANGTIIRAERLFCHDRQAPYNPEDDAPGLLLKEQIRKKRSLRHSDKTEIIPVYLTSIAKAKTVSIPIHSSIASINLSHQIFKYNEKKDIFYEKDLQPYPQFPLKFTQFEQIAPGEVCRDIQKQVFGEAEYCDSQQAAGEEKYLRNAVASKIHILKTVYDTYATLACDEQPQFKCLLLRLFFWQMLIDCEIPDSYRSLVQIDDLLAGEDYLVIMKPHDPFECIRFGQFILILLTLSWNLYARHVFSTNPLIYEERVAKFFEVYKKSECKYVLKMAFDYLVENDLIMGWSNRARTKDKETLFESDLAPLEAMYAIYRDLGEPHSARDFIREMTSPQKKVNDESENNLGVHDSLDNGKDALTQELAYLPGPTPFSFVKIENRNSGNSQRGFKFELLHSNEMNARQVVDCLTRSCPGMTTDNMIVRLNHKLTFLEFYKALILCTELSLKLNKIKIIKRDLIEEHRRKLAENERLMCENDKLKDVRSISSKRSRQIMETSKLGRK